MMREIPQWVTDMRDELRNKVFELGIGYGIPSSLIMDSKTIDNSLDCISSQLEELYYRSNKKPDSVLGVNNIKFGELRNKKKRC